MVVEMAQHPRVVSEVGAVVVVAMAVAAVGVATAVVRIRQPHTIMSRSVQLVNSFFYRIHRVQMKI